MSRLSLYIAAAAAAMAVAVSLVPMVPAAADNITVPFVDRLGCGTSDASLTPVFGFAGSGKALNGAAYSPAADTSAYPGVSGSFSGVASGTNYTAYSPVGYGADTEYRATDALGFPSTTSASSLSLTIDLPHAQAVEFTVGGIQSPSIIHVSGSAGGTPVVPETAARSAEAGSATASIVSGSARVVGGQATAGADHVTERAADVWFSTPVDQLTFRLSGSGSGVDARFLVTPPVSCQSGALSMTTTGAGSPTIDAAAGRVSYQVPLTTTIVNTTGESGASLYPAVSAQLDRAFQAQGITLDSLAETRASSPACALSDGADGSGPLISSPAALAPGESCSLDLVAAVSMPQSSDDRTVALSSTLTSSTSAAARVKSTSAPLPLVFRGIGSNLSVMETGAGSALPGQMVSHTTVIRNSGSGTAWGTRAEVTVDAGGSLSDYPSSCTLGSTLQCSIGDIAPGGEAAIQYSVTPASTLAPGTTLTIVTSAGSIAQGSDAVGGYTIAIAAPPLPPLPTPPLPSQPESQPIAPAPTPSTPTVPDDGISASEPASSPSIPSPPTAAEVSAMPLYLRLGAAGIRPGTAATMRGTLGPNGSDEAASIQLAGTVSKGMAYREVSVEHAGTCTVRTLNFACTVVLQPGESAALSIRLFADTLNAPGIARQQISVESSLSSQNNAVTVTTDVSRVNETDALATAITAFTITSFPGAFLPLLALMLLALAASVAEAERRRGDR